MMAPGGKSRQVDKETEKQENRQTRKTGINGDVEA
jgi:hypothetical protein